jgi:ParB family chromosome partitioning protein
MKSTKKIIAIDKLRAFENHPYKVQDNEEMEALAESIKEHGIVSPVIVRPLENTTDEYEIISGHRRVMASRKAGITEAPALIVPLDRDGAAIVLVDSNLHREHILPSEKAFAYKMKLEAIKHQGKTSRQVVGKPESADKISDESGRQVQRYIRLTNLIPEILQYVDEGRISFTPAVELSYLNEQEQQDLLEQIEQSDCTPSLSQACRFKKISQGEGLTPEVIAEIMEEEKANQKERVKIPAEKLRKYFPKNYTVEQIENEIIKLCEKNYRNKQRDAR